VSKQVKNQADYNNWCYIYHPNLDDLLIKSTTIPKIHLANHHGKKELTDFCNKLMNCKYITEIHSTDWGGKRFIRKINNDNSIEIVLYWTQKEYALKVFTTGRNKKETEIISDLITEKYHK
jgi:predicted transposase YbfD/YdcC